MLFIKYPLPESVLQATEQRIQWVMDNFSRICVSFSGGKDSTVMLHLTAQAARLQGKKICVLFIDWEAQFSCTIAHCEKLRALYADVIETFYWVALPLTTQNALTQYKPQWQCWEPGTEWVRQPPPWAITHPGYFSFYQPGMSFEAFVSHFAEWFSQRRPAAVLVGIRADESLNRFMTISSQRKQRFADDKPWTTSVPGGHAWYIYPLYDWKTADIWTWFAKSGEPYNPLYDLMYQAGVPLRYMRICEPFGPEQRQGVWLYHVLEPERWAAMCQRVSGAHSGGVYAGHDNQFYGHRKIDKPDHLTGKATPCSCSTACRKPPPSTTAIKSPSTCAGTRKKVWRIFRIPNLRTLAPKISYPGGESAKYCSITITGAVSFRLAQPKAATISATVNAWKNIANNGGFYATTTDAGAGSLPAKAG
ncbi:co-activator of prophage gene expression IbrA [Klebsiella pneumoniae]|nr:co-activator of prophage gene expression IbrA [Klebsiella pneumoniae]